MVLTKVTSKGQVTVPREIIQKLNLNELGQVVIENANIKVFSRY